ncbi:MAG TPA: hypothetical protein PLD67_08585, partial [Sedimentibacter sp.]|nr:hypothetical protein [Sedimentibacter sp.]
MNKLGKDCMPCTVKRSMAIILTLMMIISTLLNSGNLIYAFGDGEMVLKSANHTETVRGAVIEGTTVTFTVPFGYTEDKLDLSDISYELEAGFEKVDIEFPSGYEAVIGGS